MMSSFLIILILSLQLSSNETPLNILDNPMYKILIPTTNPDKGESSVEVIENLTSKSTHHLKGKEGQDIFAVPPSTKVEGGGDTKDSFDIILLSPLESAEAGFIQLKADLISILNNVLSLHGIMVYLICVLIFIFTIKIVIDKNISIDRVKFLPLGKFIHFILSRLISSWRFSTTTWIYIILSLLLIFLCSSSYIIYTCILILNTIN